jgi:hypothetical protein
LFVFNIFCENVIKLEEVTITTQGGPYLSSSGRKDGTELKMEVHAFIASESTEIDSEERGGWVSIWSGFSEGKIGGLEKMGEDAGFDGWE